MRVAIIGARVAGLSCALEFEKNGVAPDIYEKDKKTGWLWPSVSFWPRLFTNEVGDIINHLNEKYGIGVNYITRNK